MSIDKKAFGISDSLVNAVNEALKGGQVKLDKNHNGKLDSDDFKKLRGEGAKPDFLDLDKDGNKKEPMKKAATAGEKEDKNYKHSMMKNEVADGNKANFKQNMKEGAEQIDEKVKTTHENPLVTVHDKDGLHTHANLSTANKIFNTKVKHTDVHAGPVKTKDGHETKNNLTFAISKHHALAMKEEAEQIDELSKETLQSYRTKALSHKSKVSPDNPYSSPEHKAAVRQDRNRSQGRQLSWKKMIHQGAKVPASRSKPTTEEVVDEAASVPNVAADMAARKTEVQRKIAAKQASMQMAKANKRISGSPMKEAKCSCGEAKESKMTCEVHGDNKGLKGGKEPIIMNPPLKEASNLPKAVVSKGHEIAKSLIKHKSTVKEPYAVGMAAAKKSAGIKEDTEQVDELSKATMGSYIKKASHDVATKSAATGRYADRANTVKDQMKKGDYSNYQQGKKDDAIANKMFDKSWKRRTGIAKAVDKLSK
jgi:hypothetical protein